MKPQYFVRKKQPPLSEPNGRRSLATAQGDEAKLRKLSSVPRNTSASDDSFAPMREREKKAGFVINSIALTVLLLLVIAFYGSGRTERRKPRPYKSSFTGRRSRRTLESFSSASRCSLPPVNGQSAFHLTLLLIRYPLLLKMLANYRLQFSGSCHKNAANTQYSAFCLTCQKICRRDSSLRIVRCCPKLFVIPPARAGGFLY